MLTPNQFTVLQLIEGPWPVDPENFFAEEDLREAEKAGLVEKFCADAATGEEWWRLTDAGRKLIETVDPEDRVQFDIATEMFPRPPEAIPGEQVLAAAGLLTVPEQRGSTDAA